MNTKKVIKRKSDKHTIILHIKAGMANAAPPIGPALSQRKVNIMAFCNAFNEETKDRRGQVLPTHIFVTEGGKYTFKVLKQRVSDLIRQKFGFEKGSQTPGREDFKTLSREDLRDIAREKFDDLKAADEEAAISTIAGTARSMGIKIVG